MNAARAMGNMLDAAFVPDLEKALAADGDERVRKMCAWSLGRIGGQAAKKALEKQAKGNDEGLTNEIENALLRTA